MPALPPGRAHGHPARWGAASSPAVRRHLARLGGVLAGHPLSVPGPCLDLRPRADPARRYVDGRLPVCRRRDPRIDQDGRHADSTQRVRRNGRDRHGRLLSGSERRRPCALHLTPAGRLEIHHWRADDRRGRCGFLRAARSSADHGRQSGGRTDLLTLGRFGSRSRRCAHRGHGPACRDSRAVGDRNHRMSVVPPLSCRSQSFCLMSIGDARRCDGARPRHPLLGWCEERRCWTGPPSSPNPPACGGCHRHGRLECGRRCRKRSCLCAALHRLDSAHRQHATRSRFAVGSRVGYAGRRLIRLTAPSSNHSSSSSIEPSRVQVGDPGGWTRLRAGARGCSLVRAPVRRGSRREAPVKCASTGKYPGTNAANRRSTRIGRPLLRNKETRPPMTGGLVRRMFGSVLVSHTVSSAVPSAL